jgi:type 2A phosphatase activator TIP41
MASIDRPVHDSYPSAQFPDDATVNYAVKGWNIQTRKLPISKSDAIDAMSDKIGIPIPEMIFGDNLVAIEHVASKWRLEFNPVDALDRVDKTDKTMLKVAYSKEWSASRCVIWTERKVVNANAHTGRRHQRISKR